MWEKVLLQLTCRQNNKTVSYLQFGKFPTMFRLEQVIISFILLSCATSDQLFTSVARMANLLKVKSNLVSTLKIHLQEEHSRLQAIESRLKQISNNFNPTPKHQIDQFHFIKRWTYQKEVLEEIVSLVKNGSSPFKVTEKSSLPVEGDMIGALQALLRLQRTYKLDTKILASGKVQNVTADQPLTTEDCFLMGYVAFMEEEFDQCQDWMGHVLNVDDFPWEAEELMSDCTSKLSPGHNTTKELDENESKTPAETSEKSLHRKKSNNKNRKSSYERLCRNPPHLRSEIERQLKCYYWTNTNLPRLLLRPAKLEQLYLSPTILRFHDVISDREIMTLQKLALPIMERSGISGGRTLIQLNHLRVSQTAWLADSDHSTVDGVSKRIEDITGLSTSTAEDFQVVNYGIGGQYQPHHDYIMGMNGDGRLATFLLYLSDVQYGGSTVFLEPEVAVRPIKGSAVFWYNIDEDGRKDQRTLHAACPVLIGNKWVANKWILERGQKMNHRPHSVAKQPKRGKINSGLLDVAET